jgi:hypothetical protein
MANESQLDICSYDHLLMIYRVPFATSKAAQK